MGGFPRSRRSGKMYSHSVAVEMKNRCREPLPRQPLTEPTVNPAMKRSTKKLYKIATGMLEMKQAPISDPQKYTSPRTSTVGTPTLMLKFEDRVMKVRQYTNSCTTSGTVKITT